MTRIWTLQRLGCNFITLVEVDITLTFAVTFSVTTVAVVTSLCPTPLDSPRRDSNSPRRRTTFCQNPQHPQKIPILPQKIQIFLTKSPPFPNKLPIVPKIPIFKFLICLKSLNILTKIPTVPPKFSILHKKIPSLPLNSQRPSQNHKLSPQILTLPPSLLNLPPKFPVFLNISNFPP